MTTQTKTYKTIQIETFFTPAGKPTCSNSPENTCQFLLLAGWGTRWICSYNNSNLYRGGEGGLGYLICDEECPLHRGDNDAPTEQDN